MLSAYHPYQQDASTSDVTKHVTQILSGLKIGGIFAERWWNCPLVTRPHTNILSMRDKNKLVSVNTLPQGKQIWDIFFKTCQLLQYIIGNASWRNDGEMFPIIMNLMWFQSFVFIIIKKKLPNRGVDYVAWPFQQYQLQSNLFLSQRWCSMKWW